MLKNVVLTIPEELQAVLAPQCGYSKEKKQASLQFGMSSRGPGSDGDEGCVFSLPPFRSHSMNLRFAAHPSANFPSI